MRAELGRSAIPVGNAAQQVKIARLLVFSLVASLTVCGNTAALEANPASSFQLKILSPDGKRTIGTTRFIVTRDNSSEEIKGETTYTDGEHDNETERLYVGNPDSTPRLDTYKHSFFNADGTLHMV